MSKPSSIIHFNHKLLQTFSLIQKITHVFPKIHARILVFLFHMHLAMAKVLSRTDEELGDYQLHGITQYFSLVV